MTISFTAPRAGKLRTALIAATAALTALAIPSTAWAAEAPSEDGQATVEEIDLDSVLGDIDQMDADQVDAKDSTEDPGQDWDGPAGRAANKTISQVNSWINSNVGKCVGGSCWCVSLVEAYSRFLGLGGIGGHAREIYANASSAKWTKLGAGTTPKKGDVLVLDSRHGQGNGHVAVVLSYDAKEKKIRVFHQNWPGGAMSTKGDLKKSEIHITGYLRPKNLV